MSGSHAERRTFSFPYEARSLDELVSSLRAEGMTFRQFECVSEGEYSPDDAAWNYMDIPHPTYVHKQVDGVLTLAADAVTGSIFFQKLPFLRLPLTVLTYQSAPNAVTYYTSFAFFLLIIQTSWEAMGSTRTRVTTRYAVGWTGWLVGLFYPVIRKLLERNYRILMSEDIPMRNQRGVLRTKGYEFRMSGDVPSFLESKKIMQQNVLTPEQNVVAPRVLPSWSERIIPFDSLQEAQPCFIGEANHMGLTLLRSGHFIYVYPRLCPHEGAGLDGAVTQCAAAEGGIRTEPCTIQCPWHGRKFRPILTISTAVGESAFETDWHTYEVHTTQVRIACKPSLDTETLRTADWSRPAKEKTS